MFYQTLATDTLPNGHDTITCYTLTENTALPEKKKNSVLTKKKNTTLYIAVNKHASQSQVEDILRLTATSNAANTRVFNCVYSI